MKPTEPTTPAPVPTQKPSKFKIPEGNRAYLLIPFEENLKEKCSELLDGLNEEPPKVVTQIKLKRLSDLDVIFTAIPRVTKLNSRKQPVEWTLVISPAIQVGKFMMESSAEDIWDNTDPDYGAVVDALQKHCMPLCVKMSEDKICKILSA